MTDHKDEENSEITRYITKVRKLIALSESSNPHESERARSQANAMIAKHHLYDHFPIKISHTPAELYAIISDLKSEE